jgi:ankyrin repeat protein
MDQQGRTPVPLLEYGTMRAAGLRSRARPLFVGALVLGILAAGLFGVTTSGRWLRAISGLPTGNELLFDSLASGDSPLIAEALSHGASVSARDAYDQTPLMWAATLEDTKWVAAFLRAGADPNARSKDDATPLAWATHAGNVRAMALLLRAGASLEGITIGHRTPLHEAAKDGHAAALSLLIASGANVNARDAWNRTPLHWAAELEPGRREEITDMLLAAGAQPDAVDGFGNMALAVARVP